MNGFAGKLQSLKGRERPLSAVPMSVWTVLFLAFIAQLIWHANRPAPSAFVTDIPPAPTPSGLAVVAVGEPVAMSRLSYLWLQTLDDPPGTTTAFKDLDYEVLSDWLGTLLALDPRADAPLLAASKLYINVPDERRQRLMLDFVHQSFLEAPNERWRWLAHGALIARHKLKDLDLALRLSQAIAEHTDAEAVPGWARSLGLLVLEDLCELDAAKIMLGGLLANHALTDAEERRFLERKLEELDSTVGCPQRVEEQFPQLSPNRRGMPFKN